MVVHEKKGSSDLPSLCFQLTSPHCPVTRESSARKDDDVAMAKESGTKRGGKGKTVMTRISIPRAVAPRQRRQFSGANLPPARIHGVYSTSSV